MRFRLRPGSTMTALGSAFFAGIGLCLVVTGPSTAAGFGDFPLVIFCEDQGITNAFYFSQLDSTGTAVYLTPDRQVGTITIAGVAESIHGERSGSCKDKTLSDLRAAGQAFDK